MAEARHRRRARLRRLLDGGQPGINLQLTSALTELERRQSATEARLAEVVETVGRQHELTVDHTDLLRELRAWLEECSGRGDAVAGRLEAFIADQERSREQIGAALAQIDRRMAGDAPLHGDGGLALETFTGPAGDRVVGFRDGGPDRADGVYLGFEDYFRGSEEEIRARQRDYLPLLEDRAPVLDVGCGRGELLEVMRDAGIEAAGVDLDPAMVRRCRAKGLDAVEGDAVTHLEGIAAGSLGTVFAAQVIEHLPYAQLLRFLRAAREALAPAGALIVETVNPHSPQALKHFWIDPTHQHPLFGETVLALCRLTGFTVAYIWYPQGSGDPDRDRQEQLDYAVVAQATR